MSGPAPISPVARFLGDDAIRGGAIGLLGLTPEFCTRERVLASLEWQLDRVAQHAEADTPEADEVRLALHAAAAQLLDPDVRQALAGRLGAVGVGAPDFPANSAHPAFTPDSPDPAPTTPGTAISPALLAEARKVLARFGGLTAGSMQHLAFLSVPRGVAPEALIAALRAPQAGNEPAGPPAGGNGRRRPAAPSRPGPAADPISQPGFSDAPRAQPDSDDEEQDPATKFIRNALLLGGVAFLVLVCFLIFFAVLISSPVDSGERTAQSQLPRAVPAPVVKERPPDPDTHPPTAAKTEKPRTVPIDHEDPRFTDPKAVVRALRDCASQAAKEPEQAAVLFSGAIKAFSARWPRFDPAERRAADAAVVDCVYATAAWPEASARVLDAIIAGSGAMSAGGAFTPADVLPAACSVGILTRLLHERELPTDVFSRIEGVVSSAIGQERVRFDSAFEGGATAALRRMPVLLLAGSPSPATPAPSNSGEGLFTTWIEAVGAVSGADEQQRERLLIDGLEAVMTQGPEPGADRRVFGVIQDLVVQIKWRGGGPGRARLMDWFSDPRLSNADIQVLTGALATRSSAEGVDQSMVLSSAATSGDRQRLRAQYAKAWGMAEAAGRNKLAGAWVSAARRELAKSLSASAPLDLLESTVTLSQLSEAAARLWRGETEAADKLVSEAGDAAARARSVSPKSVQKIAGAGGEGDARWIVAYLSAGRNIPVRLERLKELENSTVVIGSVDAGLLAELACRESPVEVRAAAQQAVEKFADQAVMVNAVLAYLPLAPKYASVGAMVERVAHKPLPKVTEPNWELQARRALVERLLEMVAAGSDQASVAGLGNLLGESYLRRAGEDPATGQTAPRDAASEVARSIRALRIAWRAEAQALSPNQYSPLTLEEIDGRRRGREVLADGPVQAAAVDQVSIAELMTYVVTAEHPARAAKARSILDDMGAARRKASHVFGQLAATERAILELWILRLSEDGK